MFRIPYYQNQQFTPGFQLVNFGSGGPQSHMGLLAIAPLPEPLAYNVRNKGMAMIPPRYIFGPTMPVIVNQYSNPLTINNLEISGIFKSPIQPA